MARAHIKDKRKQQLINATIDSIAKRGLTETTITHISKGAGMSRGIINFYFTSKEMMMQAVLDSLMNEYDSFWQTAADRQKSDPKAELEAILAAHFDKKLCQPKRLKVLSAFWGHAASHAVYRERIEASDAALRDKVSALWARISPNGYQSDAFARQLHAMIRGLWLSFLMAPQAVKREDLAAECRAFVEGHLQPLQLVETRQGAVSKRKFRTAKDKTQLDIEDLFASAG